MIKSVSGTCFPAGPGMKLKAMPHGLAAIKHKADMILFSIIGDEVDKEQEPDVKQKKKKVMCEKLLLQ